MSDNYYIMLGIDPTLDKWEEIESIIEKHRRKWAREQSGGPLGVRHEAARRMKLLPDIRETLKDPQSRDKHRQEAKAEQDRKYKEEHETVRVSFGLRVQDIKQRQKHVDNDQLEALVQKFGHVVNREEIIATLKKEGLSIGVFGEQKEWQLLDESKEKSINELLAILKKSDLYEFLGKDRNEPLEILDLTSNKLYKTILADDNREFRGIPAARQLAGYCLDIFSQLSKKEMYDNTCDSRRMEKLEEEIENKGIDGILEEVELTELLNRSREEGVRIEFACDYIQLYAHRKEWRITTDPSLVAEKIAQASRSTNTSRRHKHQEVDGYPNSVMQIQIDCNTTIDVHPSAINDYIVFDLLAITRKSENQFLESWDDYKIEDAVFGGLNLLVRVCEETASDLSLYFGRFDGSRIDVKQVSSYLIGEMHNTVEVELRSLAARASSGKKRRYIDKTKKETGHAIRDKLSRSLSSTIDILVEMQRKRGLMIENMQSINKRHIRAVAAVQKASSLENLYERIKELKYALAISFFRNEEGIRNLYISCSAADDWQLQLQMASPFFISCHRSILDLDSHDWLRTAVGNCIKRLFEDNDRRPEEMRPIVDFLKDTVVLNNDEMWVNVIRHSLQVLLYSRGETLSISNLRGFCSRAQSGLDFLPETLGNGLAKEKKEILINILLSKLRERESIVPVDPPFVSEVLALDNHIIEIVGRRVLVKSFSQDDILKQENCARILRFWCDTLSRQIWTKLTNSVADDLGRSLDNALKSIIEDDVYPSDIGAALNHLVSNVIIVDKERKQFWEERLLKVYGVILERDESSYPSTFLKWILDCLGFGEAELLWGKCVSDRVEATIISRDFDFDGYAELRDRWLADQIPVDFDLNCRKAFAQELLRRNNDIKHLSAKIHNLYECTGGDMAELVPLSIQGHLRDVFESLSSGDSVLGQLVGVEDNEFVQVFSYFKSRQWPILKESILAYVRSERIENSVFLTLRNCYFGKSILPLELLIGASVEQGWLQIYIKGTDANGTFEINKLPSIEAGQGILEIAKRVVGTVHKGSDANQLMRGDWWIGEYLVAMNFRQRSHVICLNGLGRLTSYMLKQVVLPFDSDAAEVSVKDLFKELYDTCARFRDEGVLHGKRLQMKIRENVYEYIGVPRTSEIYLVVDCTAFKSAKAGVAITASGIYYRNPFSREAMWLDWDDFATSELRRSGDDIHFGEGRKLSLSVGDVSSRRFFGLLSNLQTTLANFSEIRISHTSDAEEVRADVDSSMEERSIGERSHTSEVDEYHAGATEDVGTDTDFYTKDVRREKQKSIFVAYLLWLVSVCGLFGGHRFYLGRRKTGVIMPIIGIGSVIAEQPIVLGLLLIWMILDLFLIPRMVRK